MKQSLFIWGVLIFLCSCKDTAKPEEQRKNKQDSLLLTAQEYISILNDEPGIIGILAVPETLVLGILDSAVADEVPLSMSEDFSRLTSDLQKIGAEIDGPQGVRYYNNDPKNFKFECIQGIKSKPAQTPEHSRIMGLGAENLLVYNYYGPYGGAFVAYDEIRQYCDKHHLLQNGPLREFYPAISLRSDSSKNLTRIMVPVSLKQ